MSLGILSRAGPVVKRRYAIVTTHEQHVDDHDHDHDDDHHNDLEQVMAVRPEGTFIPSIGHIVSVTFVMSTFFLIHRRQ